MQTATSIAVESGHWYAKDGSPCYTMTGKNGKERAVTLRDARELALVPSVSGITQMLPKPALDAWKVNQGIMAALTLPRIAGETDEQFIARVVQDSKEQARKAAEEGGALHGALERDLQCKQVDPRWQGHVSEVHRALLAVGVDLRNGQPEHSFASPLGYGGKCDWHSRPQNVLLDFKSKPKIEDGKQMAYDEHLLQLVAYAKGFGLPDDCRLLNVFIGVQDRRVVVHDWSALAEHSADHERAWTLFQSLLRTWQLVKRYAPETRAAA